MNAMPEGEMAPQRSWWSRNWKWVVPAGCLGMVATCGCLVAIFAGLGISSLGKAVAFTEAVAVAQSDPEVRRALGTPIDNGLPRQTEVQSRNGRTHARFLIPLDGPQADGLLHVDAVQEDDEVRYRTLYVELQDGTRIDLLDAVPTLPDAAPVPDAEDDLVPPEPPMPPEPPRPPPGTDEAQPGGEGGSDIEL